MKKTLWAALAVPLTVALAGCPGERPQDDDTLLPADTAVDRSRDVPGAPGSITPDVDTEPRPRLRPDTLPTPPDTAAERRGT